MTVRGLTEPHSASPVELQERLAADRRAEPYLLHRDGEARQVILALGAAVRMTIGRSPAADVPLPWDLSVSRGHAVLERDVDGWWLIDDGRSMNGSFINGERVRSRRRLRDRDTIGIGDTLILFRDPGRMQSESTLPSIRVPEPVRISDAQRRVLVALCRPYGEEQPFPAPATNEAIARELVVSVDAVKTQLRALYVRFGIEQLARNQKRARLVELAFAAGAVGDADYTPAT